MPVSSILSVVLVLSAYLLGAIPTGYIAGQYLKGIDIREHGSGSTGATNVFRTIGKKAGIVVLIIDLLKGVGAVALIKIFFIFNLELSLIPSAWQPWLVAAAAIAAVVGHSKSIWIKFTGGKSVATSLGVLMMMSPVVSLGTIAVFVLIFTGSRIVSLSSISGVIAVNIFMLVLGKPLPYIFFTGIAGLYVIWRHRSNIKRILTGTEPQLGQKASQ